MSFFRSLGKILKPVGAVASLVPGVGTAVGAGISGLGALADKVGGAVNLAGGVAGIGSLIQGDRRNSQALGAQREAMNMARGRHNETAPLRALSIEQLTAGGPGMPDLSGTFMDPTNPFARSAQTPEGMNLLSLEELQRQGEQRRTAQ